MFDWGYRAVARLAGLFDWGGGSEAGVSSEPGRASVSDTLLYGCSVSDAAAYGCAVADSLLYGCSVSDAQVGA
jgi:hypothetical protein